MIRHHIRQENLPANKLRMPPAAHKSFIASMRGRPNRLAAFTGDPSFTASMAAFLLLVCAIKYTFRRSRGAVAVLEAIPAQAPARK
jgi:hypothetical protein